MITEMMKMNQIDQQKINEMKQQMDTVESHHTKRFVDMYDDAHSNMSTDGNINYIKDVVEVDEEIGDSHIDISTDGYDDDAQCEYKVLFVNEDMSKNDDFQE